jgi:predicted aspartyl protease
VRRFAVLAVFVGLFVVPAAAVLGAEALAKAADRARPRVPLTIDEHGAVIVEVRVNDAGPFKFIVDTGSARSAVADGLARELGAPIVAKSEVVTSAGSEIYPVARLATVAVGARSEMYVNGILAPILPASRLIALGRGVRGVLGQDFLSAFNYTLDYRLSRLTWDAPFGCEGPDVVRMAALEGRFVMTLDAAGPLRLVPDSGADALVLFASRARTVSGVRHSGATVRDLSGARLARMTTVPRLRLGGVTVRDVDAFVVDRTEPGVDGLMPLHRFASVSFAAGGACLVARQ